MQTLKNSSQISGLKLCESRKESSSALEVLLRALASTLLSIRNMVIQFWGKVGYLMMLVRANMKSVRKSCVWGSKGACGGAREYQR